MKGLQGQSEETSEGNREQHKAEAEGSKRQYRPDTGLIEKVPKAYFTSPRLLAAAISWPGRPWYSAFSLLR